MTFNNKKWRLNNLYRIIKDGSSIPFRLNKIQEIVLDNPHKRSLILKARQLGMSTYAIINIVDDVLFNENHTCGIVSYNLEHAKHIFKKIVGHALDTLPKEIRSITGMTQRSAREITFNNGSSLRVDTSLRGGSYQNVLISEYGKTCARNPQKAEEVITGTLQAVGKKGTVIIESTGEGTDGYFADMVMESNRRGNDNLSALDFHLFFFPWMDEPSYSLEEDILSTADQNDYFERIEKETGRTISKNQRNWYIIQSRILGDKIRQEFPSTVSEAFLSSSDAYYFAQTIEGAYNDNRCLTHSIYDALMPVYVAMDIGVNDMTVIIFFQIVHGEIRIIDYHEDNNKGVEHYVKFFLQDKPYLYNTIFLPHDSKKRDQITGENTYERDFRRLVSHTQIKIQALKAMDKQLSISHTKNMINRMVFNISRVKKLLDQCSKYRKIWHEGTGRYLPEPYHNLASNYADALRYVAQAVAHLEAAQGIMGAFDKHKQATDSRFKRVY